MTFMTPLFSFVTPGIWRDEITALQWRRYSGILSQLFKGTDMRALVAANGSVQLKSRRIFLFAQRRGEGGTERMSRFMRFR